MEIEPPLFLFVAMNRICFWVILAFITTAGNNLRAQNHYWSQQYGAVPTLTGGSAVAGALDNSSIYYNPGAVGFIDSPKISASCNLYGFESIHLKNGAGTGIDLKSLRFNVFPQIVSGSVPIANVPRLKILYGTLTRFRTNIRFNQEARFYYNVIANSPGDEYYKARLEYQNNSIEQWGGLGLAYKIDSIFSVGLTSFVAYTNIETRSAENLNTDAFYNGQPYTASVNEYNSLRLDQVNMIFKLGLAVNMEHIKLGMTVTMPSIKIWGKGRLDKSFEAYNLNLNAVDTNIPAEKYPTLILSDEQDKLKTDYRMPASFAFGAKVVYPKFKLSASVEYFFGYKNVKVIQGEDRTFIRPTAAYGGDTIKGYMNIVTSARPVLNAGFGAEWQVKKKIALLAGVRTDFNNRTDFLPNNGVANVLSVRLPIYHYLYFSVGATYKFGTHDLSAGFDYGLGLSADRTEIFNMSEPEQNLLLRGRPTNNMQTKIHSLSFVIGYTYYFKAIQKRYPEVSAR